jgi:uncharacterized protein
LPGDNKKIFLQVGKIYDSTDINMPVHVIRSFTDGPVVFLSAAIHGDEINGVEIIKEVMQVLSKVDIVGTVIAVPIVNVFGFNNQSRYLPDRRDLNRSFPGSAKGSLAARMAHMFVKEIVTKCTHGIDFHTGAIHRSIFPQIRVNMKSEKSLTFAKAFGAPIILNSDVKDGSLRETGKKKGVVTMVYEAGQALRFEEDAIKIGKQGCLNALSSIGVYPKMPTKIKNPLGKSPILIQDSFWVRSPKGGTLRLKVKLGQFVKKGDKLGEISGPFGQQLESVFATGEGYILGVNHLPLVTIGTAIVHIGTSATNKINKKSEYISANTYIS